MSVPGRTVLAMRTTVPFGEARAQLRDLVCRAEYGGERIVITRHRAPVAVLVSVRDLELLESIDGGSANTGRGSEAEVSTTIEASLAVVWNALTSTRRRMQWWPALDLDPSPGGEVVADWERRIGRVVDVVEGETLTVRFGDERSPVRPVEVRFDLARTDVGVTVRIRATGPGPDVTFWQGRLDAWSAYAEEVSAT